MIRWRMCNIVKRFADNGDDVLLANFERVRGFDAEWKLLRRPAKHYLPNLTPLWANWNFGADSSNVVSVGICKRDVNVAVASTFASTMRPVSAYHFSSDGILASVMPVKSTSGPSPSHA